MILLEMFFKKGIKNMINEKRLENHYKKLPTLQLKELRHELLWLAHTSMLNTKEITMFVEKELVLRGEQDLETSENEEPRKILLLCQRCNFSQIQQIEPPFEEANAKIFEMISKPCPRCRKMQYSWKYMDS